MIARVGKKNKVRGPKGGGSGFKYKKRSAESVKKRADQRGGNFDSPVKGGIDMWRPQNGENVIRILPATWEDFEHYGYDVYMHRFIGSDSSNYICLNKMKGKHCPACKEAKAAKDGGEEDEAKQLAFSKRCWVWIIDRADKTETPQIWDMSWSQDRDISGLTYFKSGKVLLIDHPDDGYDVIVKKTGSGLKTKYSFNIERDSSPISDDEDKQEEILNYIQENPIPSVLNFFSADHIAKKLEGTTEERDDDLDDDEDEDSPRTRKAGRRSRDEDEDDDEDEAPKKKKKKRPIEDEEDEDDEDERPKKKRKKPAEDDDDEDEEDETPRRKKRKPDPDDDDEDEEEDERPAKKKKRKPDPDEDDEDEEEDERPKKKKKRRVEEDDEDEEEERPKKKKRKPDPDEDDEDEDDDD